MEGNIIMDRDLKRSIILDNYQNPNMKHTSNEDYVKHLYFPSTNGTFMKNAYDLIAKNSLKLSDRFC